MRYGPITADPPSEEDLPVGRLIKELADPETRELIAAAAVISS